MIYLLENSIFEAITEPVDITIFNMIGEKMYYNRFNNVSGLLNFRVPIFTVNEHYVLQITYGSTTLHEQIMFR